MDNSSKVLVLDKAVLILGALEAGPHSLAELVAATGIARPTAHRLAVVASVSAPVRAPNGKVVAAVSISGPIERLSRQPGRIHSAAVVATADRLSEYLAKGK